MIIKEADVYLNWCLMLIKKNAAKALKKKKRKKNRKNFEICVEGFSGFQISSPEFMTGLSLFRSYDFMTPQCKANDFTTPPHWDRVDSMTPHFSITPLVTINECPLTHGLISIDQQLMLIHQSRDCDHPWPAMINVHWWWSISINTIFHVKNVTQNHWSS